MIAGSKTLRTYLVYDIILMLFKIVNCWWAPARSQEQKMVVQAQSLFLCPHQHHQHNFLVGVFFVFSWLKFDRFQTFLFLIFCWTRVHLTFIGVAKAKNY